ncbi:hypothetical protein VN24_26045 [Paenibacillus beijingensis]|uniref:Uncharacterized protein n=1 Tax=Paenibacillus beijingensis TaxID=1126833 RepID=A0A0D5NQ47_9BACL|nr:hypothetical protein VN24_26045 [Paenibacillus beijingensis]
MHNFIVTDVDMGKKKIMGIDPYYAIEHVCMSFEEFLQGGKSIIVYHGKKDSDIPNNRNLLRNELTSGLYGEYSLYSRMQQFCSDISSKKFSFEDGPQIIYQLSKVISGRTEFILLLDYLSKKSKINFDSVKVDLRKAAEQWNLIGALLMKHLLLQKEGTLNKVLSTINDVVNLELEIRKNLMTLTV